MVTPVFVTTSGTRRPAVRFAGRIFGLLAAGYLGLTAVGLSGTPSVVDPLPFVATVSHDHKVADSPTPGGPDASGKTAGFGNLVTPGSIR